MQSLDVILSTRRGTRIERREVGSDAPDLLDKPAVGDTILDHFVAIAMAIDEFEPEVDLAGFSLTEADEDGNAKIIVQLVRADGQKMDYLL